ncbi:TTN [Mytilus edulis]|uniref:TTN n=1 Tax=Mytilus edulis TaxID=6550 RepID=A0A8S3QBY6_MYTED|nr:TTN [Mytilus edulis]
MPVKVETRDVSHNTTFLKFYPPVDLKRTAYSIHLQWTPTTINPEKILHYELRYRKQCGSKWLITHTIGNENEINVSKLEANIEYEFKLQWTPSENIQHVDSYDIRYKTSPNGKWSLLTTGETEHTICDLLERTEYEFKVRAIYGDKDGSFSETIKTSTRCKDQVLSQKFQIEKLHVTDISNNAATIEWDLPENSPHMQVYEVKYRQRPRGKWYFEEITTNKITLQNLKEASTYQCKVRIFTKGQECRFSDTISVTTTNKNIADENQKPGSPQKEHSTFNIIQIKWKIPVNLRGLRHYDVLYRNFKTEQWIKSTTNENKATINNLEPSSEYEFKGTSSVWELSRKIQ